MKKWIALLLLLAIVLTLCACGADKESASESTGGSSALDGVFSVGFGRVDITPDESVPLRGYGGDTSQRMSNGFLDYLYASCVAMTDESGNTMLLIHTDLIGSLDVVSSLVLKAVSKRTGVPEQNVAFAATHTHHGPDMSNTKESSIQKYNNSLPGWIADAAEAAMADRAPASMYIGSVTIPANTLNFIRHYNLSDGTYAGDNFGDFTGTTILGHTHDADSTMQLIQFKREGAEDVVMVNWQAHPHRTGAFNESSQYYNSLTSDIVGAMRSKMEKELGCKFAYFTGASGNVNSHSNITKENITADPWEQGEALADYALEILKDTKAAETGTIRSTTYTYEGPTDKSKVHLLDKANMVNNYYISSGKDLKKSIQYAKSLGLNSWHEAMAIITKSQAGDTATLPMYAMSCGSVGFVVAPYEMFDENGLYIKENSPFDMTFVITCANGANGYISSTAGFVADCYGSNTGKFADGCAEAIAAQYVTMLEELYNTK